MQSYLQKKLKQHGLTIMQKTEDEEWAKRGKGILDFINRFPGNVESFVILDDERFDFEFVGIDDKLVKTDFCKGLLPEHVEKAVNILNGCKS